MALCGRECTVEELKAAIDKGGWTGIGAAKCLIERMEHANDLSRRTDDELYNKIEDIQAELKLRIMKSDKKPDYKVCTHRACLNEASDAATKCIEHTGCMCEKNKTPDHFKTDILDNLNIITDDLAERERNGEFHQYPMLLYKDYKGKRTCRFEGCDRLLTCNCFMCEDHCIFKKKESVKETSDDDGEPVSYCDRCREVPCVSGDDYCETCLEDITPLGSDTE